MGYNHFTKCPNCGGKHTELLLSESGRPVEVCSECVTPVIEFVDDLEVSVIGVPDDILNAHQRIAQLEADNKRLARHSELLRAVTLSLWESYSMITDYIGELPNGTMRGVVSGCFKGCANKMQAAIDGGALEEE